MACDFRFQTVLLLATFCAVGCVGCFRSDVKNIAALEGRDLSFLSRRGAHTYVEATSGGKSPDNALYARQYSDLLSHIGMYKPVLAPLLEPADELECEVKSRVWNPDAIVQVYQCAAGEITLEIAYMSYSDIAVRVSVSNDWTLPDVPIRGCAINEQDFVDSTVSKDSGLVFIEQEIQLFSFWGGEQKETRDTFVEIVPKVSPAIDGRCWSAVLDAQVSSVVSFRMHENWFLEINNAVASCIDDDDFSGGRSPYDIEWPPDTEVFDAALKLTRLELIDWFTNAPVSDFNDQMAVMSWFIAWENTARPWGSAWTRPAVVPSKRHYFRGVWLWDSAFTAVMLAHGNADARELGRQQVRLMIDNQAEDGRLAREIWAHEVGPGFQPPGPLTWAALVLSVKEGNHDLIDEVYDSLVAYHKWIATDNDSDGDGRSEWDGLNSGMDTSPRFDDGAVEGVDLQSWMAFDALLLAKMAQYLGFKADERLFKAEAERRVNDLANNFWDDTDQMFYDRRIDDSLEDPFVRVITPVSFLPLLVGAADKSKAAAMAAHLSDPSYLKVPYGVPTVSSTSKEYNPEDYWRGPVWIVTNAFVIWALEQYGLEQEALALRSSTLAMIAAEQTPREYYNSQTGAGLGATDFMWSGVFYLLLSGDISPADVL